MPANLLIGSSYIEQNSIKLQQLLDGFLTLFIILNIKCDKIISLKTYIKIPFVASSIHGYYSMHVLLQYAQS